MITFTLTYEFYEMIITKKKTHEYRSANKFWNSRISKLQIGDKIKFTRGYTKEYVIAIVINYDFINREMLPGYAKKYFKSYLKFFHDIRFILMEEK